MGRPEMLPCSHNIGVECDKPTRCHECGWNPKVAKLREAKLRCGRKPGDKPYRVSFTGYSKVWASSSQEALIKAQNKNSVLTQHYFTRPEEMEEEDGMD